MTYDFLYREPGKEIPLEIVLRPIDDNILNEFEGLLNQSPSYGQRPFQSSYDDNKYFIYFKNDTIYFINIEIDEFMMGVLITGQNMEEIGNTGSMSIRVVKPVSNPINVIETYDLKYPYLVSSFIDFYEHFDDYQV